MEGKECPYCEGTGKVNVDGDEDSSDCPNCSTLGYV